MMHNDVNINDLLVQLEGDTFSQNYLSQVIKFNGYPGDVASFLQALQQMNAMSNIFLARNNLYSTETKDAEKNLTLSVDNLFEQVNPLYCTQETLNKLDQLSVIITTHLNTIQQESITNESETPEQLEAKKIQLAITFLYPIMKQKLDNKIWAQREKWQAYLAGATLTENEWNDLRNNWEDFIVLAKKFKEEEVVANFDDLDNQENSLAEEEVVANFDDLDNSENSLANEKREQKREQKRIERRQQLAQQQQASKILNDLAAFYQVSEDALEKVSLPKKQEKLWTQSRWEIECKLWNTLSYTNDTPSDDMFDNLEILLNTTNKLKDIASTQKQADEFEGMIRAYFSLNYKKTLEEVIAEYPLTKQPKNNIQSTSEQTDAYFNTDPFYVDITKTVIKPLIVEKIRIQEKVIKGLKLGYQPKGQRTAVLHDTLTEIYAAERVAKSAYADNLERFKIEPLSTEKEKYKNTYQTAINTAIETKLMHSKSLGKHEIWATKFGKKLLKNLFIVGTLGIGYALGLHKHKFFDPRTETEQVVEKVANKTKGKGIGGR
ncbi:MAG TPA: hypothetical protein VHZ76_06525 [Gammaproteobacteria bacterium]|jgi:hypothetical protein|nr:hypothetical protein [Gammaproteobacteria bacterium]